MKFLIDAQLPPTLVHWLDTHGYQAQHVEEVGLRAATDQAIWALALSQQAIIVTKDEDFAERAARDVNSPIIVWLRLGNATNRALLRWLEPRWPQIVTLLNEGHQLIEVR